MPLLRLLSPIAVLGLLAFLLSRTDLDALTAAFSRVSIGHVVVGLVLVQGQIIGSAIRWRFTAARLGEGMPISVAIGEYYVASFLNQVLPGGMAGDAVRAYRMRNGGKGGWKRPAKAVFFERMSGQMAFFALALAGLFVWPQILGGEDAGRQTLHLVSGTLILAVVVGIGMAMARRRVSWIAHLSNDLSEVFWRNGALLVQSGLSFLVVGSYVACFFLASHAVGSPLPWTAALTIIPLSLLAMLIPAGFGGWGTREAAAMALWPLIGASSTDGLAASVIYGGLSLAGALPGLVLISLEALRGKPRRA